MLGLALMWFAPRLPIGVAGLCALVVGAYLSHLNGPTWVGGALMAFGVGALSIWLFQRRKAGRGRASNP
jgi:hypothetical protein